MNILRLESFANPPVTLLLPEVKRSRNQYPTNEFYRNPPITLPNPHAPILPQINEFLAKPVPKTRLGEPSYGPYGRLGQTRDQNIIEIKEYLAELPPTISLEARAVFLTTLLHKFHPLVFDHHQFDPLYDFGRDRHLAKNVYGGNGLYKTAEEWVSLAKGRFSGIAKKVKLPWLAMHIRHTLLINPSYIEKYADVQTAIDMIFLFEKHFRKPNESEEDYIERMSTEYWKAQQILQKHNLLPGYKKVAIPFTMVRQ